MALPTRDEITKRLGDTLDAMAAGTYGTVVDPDLAVKPHLDAILASGEYTIRDGLLTLLAMAVESGAPLDWTAVTIKGSPARSVSKYLGHEVYERLHIVGSKEALQTGVKGLRTYRDRSTTRGDWEAVLDWATIQTTLAPITVAFEYLAAGVAVTARNLPDIPSLDGPALTFASVFALLDFLLTQNSHGAFEQFIFAALYEAGVRQEGDDRSRVSTKNLNASDASSGTAGDVQHVYGGDVREAYEVTRDNWKVKVAQAEQAAKHHGLDRIHILGRGAQAASGDEIVAELAGKVTKDVSVLEVRDEVRSFVHRLTPEYRRRALQLLYEHLVERQPRDALVTLYVSELQSRGLTLPWRGGRGQAHFPRQRRGPGGQRCRSACTGRTVDL
jgi:hypothetical protein